MPRLVPPRALEQTRSLMGLMDLDESFTVTQMTNTAAGGRTQEQAGGGGEGDRRRVSRGEASEATQRGPAGSAPGRDTHR